ncbi:MAG: Cation-transporting ATPase [Candidatus Carbobacillus altaicus]|uniref:Cation-transporting ATPase n=1 Tax=Candidatus Carbonibacillus altaicus TaxID=2163959 RepID=A0A2R6XXE9_9BACL|nr:MAG: Cation-transporting ATPase [Candidatus Carbobacillus altaicus]
MWPPAQQIFGTTSLSLYDWFMSLGYAVLPFIVVGLTRFFLDHMRKMSRERA